MATIGNLNAKVTANAGPFMSEMDKASKKAEGFAKSVTKIGSIAGLVGGVITAVAASSFAHYVEEAEQAATGQ